MKLPFFIIACGAQKLPYKAKAAKLYTGPLFTATLAYARFWAPDDRILILSAKHGLVRLDTPLFPYNVTINQANGAWLTRRVSEQITEMVPPMVWATDITVLAGEQYATLLGAAWMMARDTPPHFERPLQGLGLFKQIQWLNNAIKEEVREPEPPTPYATWKTHKTRHDGIVIVRLDEQVAVAFDEDAETISRECMGADYVPQVLDDPTEECHAEFRFRLPHLTRVSRALMRSGHRVYLHDFEEAVVA